MQQDYVQQNMHPSMPYQQYAPSFDNRAPYFGENSSSGSAPYSHANPRQVTPGPSHAPGTSRQILVNVPVTLNYGHSGYPRAQSQMQTNTPPSGHHHMPSTNFERFGQGDFSERHTSSESSPHTLIKRLGLLRSSLEKIPVVE